MKINLVLIAIKLFNIATIKFLLQSKKLNVRVHSFILLLLECFIVTAID